MAIRYIQTCSFWRGAVALIRRGGRRQRRRRAPIMAGGIGAFCRLALHCLFLCALSAGHAVTIGGAPAPLMPQDNPNGATHIPEGFMTASQKDIFSYVARRRTYACGGRQQRASQRAWHAARGGRLAAAMVYLWRRRNRHVISVNRSW